MYEIESKYQQRFLQPIQQLALQKQPCEINGVEFLCQQTYYEGQLLNGIDLKVKEMKGLNPNPSLIDYLPDSQQLIFSASSSLVTYSTHKKSYHQLMTLEGEIVMLKVYFDKNNSREYIMWVEKHFVGKEPSLSFSKASLKKSNQRNRKKEGFVVQDEEKGDFFKNMFNNFVGKNSQPQKNQGIQSAYTYILKIFDYSKKELIFDRDIILNGEVIKQLFMFLANFRLVGYVLESRQGARRLYYKRMAKKEMRGGIAEFESRFESIQLQINMQNLKFNTEQYNYVFFDQKIFYSLYPQEITAAYNPANSFQNPADSFQNLLQSLKPATFNLPSIRMVIKQTSEFQSNIIAMAINDQYLAILTDHKIYFHSAFDTSCLIFTHEIQETNQKPLGIQFNKSILYMTFKNIPKITTFTLKTRALKQTNTTTLELEHCKEIVKIFSNNISSQLFCVIMFYELQSRRVNHRKSDKQQLNMMQYIIKPAFIDVSMSFLSPSSKTQAKILNIAKQKYQKVHICPWLSNYVVQAESQVAFGHWKQNFQNKKCLCLHPTGIYMVVCFKDAFKIYVISFDGLVNTFLGDSLNDIQACALSNLGNDLAIVTGNLLVIYDFYSCKKRRVITLPIGSIVESLQYSDFALCCFLKNKKFYAYDSFNNYQQLIAINLKAFILQSSQNISLQNTSNLTFQLINFISIRSIFYDPNLELILFSAKNSLYFYNCKSNSVIMTAQMNNITAFYYCKPLKTLFLGTQEGELLSYFWPNKPLNFNTEQIKHKLHGGQIISIGVSSDLKEVVTLADDNSLCTCQLSFVQNLKRLEGLELIEYLSTNVPISYDLLPRKGIYQYTHSKFNEKLDQIKDFEEQTENMNFILPQERWKQKEFMLNNIKEQKQQRLSKVDKQYLELNRLVEQIKQKNRKIKQTMNSTQYQIVEDLEQLKSQQLAEYMSRYNATLLSQKQLSKLKKQSNQQLLRLKKQLNTGYQEQNESFQAQYIRLQQQLAKEKDLMPKLNLEELEMIDQEKKAEISINIENLKNVINQFNANNGVLSCRNNKIQKQISQLKKRVEERKYLLERLNTSTSALTEEQNLYEQTKQQKEKRIVKEDKVNLAQIERRYVKQTKVLIQKDKEIAILTTNYNKQKGMLIHLEKLLESLESSIERVVDNILDEKQQSKKLNKQIQQITNNFTNLNLRNIQTKKDKTFLKNNIKSYVYTVELILNEIVTSAREKVHSIMANHLLVLPGQTVVIDKKEEEKELLQKLIQAKLTTLLENSEKKYSSPIKSQQKLATYRKCVTEGRQENFTSRYKKFPDSGFGSHLKRESVEKEAKKVFGRLKTENKAYERIKTQQIVYQNKRKKISLQNEDLIENYNNLVMQNKKISNILKKQQSLSKLSLKKVISRKSGQNNQTPFQQYINKKTCSSKRLNKMVVPSKSYYLEE